MVMKLLDGNNYINVRVDFGNGLTVSYTSGSVANLWYFIILCKTCMQNSAEIIWEMAIIYVCIATCEFLNSVTYTVVLFW